MITLLLIFSLSGEASELANTAPAPAQSPGEQQTITTCYTTLDTPKYPCDFKHLNYVDPEAKKGGTIHMEGWGTYTTLNPTQVNVSAAPGSQFLFESLMIRPADDPESMYPRLAQKVETAKDGSFVIFHLDPEAKFNEPNDSGCSSKSTADDHRLPVTAEDVAFSFEQNKKHGSLGSSGMGNDVTSIEILSPKAIKFNLNKEHARSQIDVLAGLTIFCKKDFEKREFKNPTLTPLRGSGAYIVDSLDNLHVTYKRVCNHWGKDKPYTRGRYNFDRVDFQIFKDDSARDASFRSGYLDLKFETEPKNWPPEGWMNRKLLNEIARGEVEPHKIDFHSAPTIEALAINEEAPALKDREVRLALTAIFPYEFQINEIDAGNSKAAEGFYPTYKTDPKVEPRVQALLKKFKEKYGAKFPDDALNPLKSPMKSNHDLIAVRRERIQDAIKHMNKAGWEMKNDPANPGNKTWFKDGQRFPDLDIPTEEPKKQLNYVEELRHAGFKVKLHQMFGRYKPIVEQGQYSLIQRWYKLPIIPGIEVPSRWASESARHPETTLNVTRTKDPVIDEAMTLAIQANPGEDRRVAMLALDRLLQAHASAILITQDPYTRFLVRNKFNYGPQNLPASGTSNLAWLPWESWSAKQP